MTPCLRDDVEAHVAATTAGLGAELVLDLVGSDATLALAARLARVRGHLTVVGIAGGTLPFNFFGLPYECSVASTYWGSITELGEVLALARAGRIEAHVEEFPLSHALDAYDRMRAGTLNGRAVIVPGELTMPASIRAISSRTGGRAAPTPRVRRRRDDAAGGVWLRQRTRDRVDHDHHERERGSSTTTVPTAHPQPRLTTPPDAVLAAPLLPLYPFQTTAEAEAWRDAYRASGARPEFLDAGATALGFAHFLGYTEVDRVVGHARRSRAECTSRSDR